MRIRLTILVTVLLLIAGGAKESATDSDETGPVVPGETSPLEPEPAFNPNQALKLSPSDTGNALHITLPEAPASRQSSPLGGPLKVGFDREVPGEFRSNLTPRIEWVTLDDGTLAGTVSVTSIGALRSGPRSSCRRRRRDPPSRSRSTVSPTSLPRTADSGTRPRTWSAPITSTSSAAPGGFRRTRRTRWPASSITGLGGPISVPERC